MDKHKYICRKCGSDDIYHDAWATWNPDNKSFEVLEVFDNTFCKHCAEDCKVELKFLKNNET